MGNFKHKPDFILLNSGCAKHNADWNFRNVYSPFARIHYVEEGSALIIKKDRSYTLRPNHLYLTPAYTKHSYACDGVLSLCYIHIYEKTNQTISIFDLYDFPVEIEAHPMDNMLIRRLLEINPGRELKNYDPHSYDDSYTLLKNIAQDQSKSFVFEMETQAILQLLFSRFMVNISDKIGQIDKRIYNALLHIHKNLHKPINISELEEICCLNGDYFIRLFKREMKITPVEYINRKKIEEAQLMLITENVPVKDIAYRISIDNIPYFYRLFKKITGETPGDYKKRITGKIG
jgi:AraC-like DNA-binding protein